MKKQHLLTITLLSLSIGLLAGCTQEKPDTSVDSSENSVSQEASDHNNTVKDLFNSMNTVDLEGNEVDTSLFSQYKMTMVNVWNTGCNPCIREIPVLDQLNKDLEAENISIKGMIYEGTAGLSDSGREDVDAILSEAGATYQNLLISEDMYLTPTLRQLTAFPTTYFVNPEGEIIATTVGARDYDHWMDTIQQALALLEEHE